MLANFIFIAYQDIKQREVFWFLFPLAALLMGSNYYLHTNIVSFVTNSLLNISFVVVVLGVLFLYAKLKLRKSFFKETFGLGDALFFIAFAFGFPFITFVIVFVFSLLFSLVLSLFLQYKNDIVTIPLAGYMAVFLVVVFVISWGVRGLNLYLL